MGAHPYRIGNGYFGSPQILTSVGGEELIQQWKNPAHTVPLSAYKLSFIPISGDCQVRINGGDPIYLLQGVEFKIGMEDKPITDFTIVTPNIDYVYYFAW